MDALLADDRQYLTSNSYVVIKQFTLSVEMKGFKKELKILKKIKHFGMKDNGGFPVVLSAKQSRTLGEILMTYVGNDIFVEFNLSNSFEDPIYHQRVEL